MLTAWILAAALASAAAPPVAAVPPTPIFRSYSMAEGLPTGDVYTVTQDHAGYLWIGTHAGLARYDSREFKVFRHDPDQPASLPANDVSAVFVANDGSLWAGGEGTGLNLHEPATGGFRHWLHDRDKSGSLSGNDVMAIAEDRAGAIWVGVYAGGLNRLDRASDTFTHFRSRKDDPASLVSDNVTALAAAADGGLWIGTDAGLMQMDPHGRLHTVALPAATPDRMVWQLRASGNGVDAATSSGLFHVDAGGRVERIGPAALASLRGPDGELWIGKRGGLTLIDRDGTSHEYAPVAGVPGHLPGRLPSDLFRDHEGGLWVAMVDGGVAYLPPQWRAFSTWRHVPDNPASLASDQIRALALADDGSLWAGGVHMLDRIDPSSRIVTHVAIPGLADLTIAKLAAARDGRLWIGTRVAVFEWDGRRLRAARDDAGLLRHGVWQLLSARDGTLYGAGIGTGAFRIDPGMYALQPLTAPASGEEAQEINQLLEAPDGAIWAATLAGLARLAPGERAFRFVPGVARGNVLAFDFGPGGALWVARGSGLEQYRLQAGSATRVLALGRGEGWPDTSIFGLKADADGRAFALGARSLIEYDPRTRQLRAFPLGHVVAVPDITGNALVGAGRGQLFAGSLSGIVGIRLAELAQRFGAPKVVLESASIRRDGRTVALDPAQPVRLGWNDRELTVAAKVLSFIDPPNNQYRFRLEGFDPGWVATETRNVREFSILDAGDYRLLVGGRTATGPWSAPLSAFDLEVSAAPWQTPAARTGYVLGLLALVAGSGWLLRRRIHQQHRLAISEERQRNAEQASNAKSRFLANMAHEIRTPLTGVLGMTELLLKTRLNERQHQYADAIRRSGALLLRQVNDALDVARIEAGRLELNPAPFDPAAILKEVAAAEAGLAAQKRLAIDIVRAPDAPRAVHGDALRVQQILFNLVHNALKFTHEGGIELKLAEADGGIVYDVIDHGLGMTPEECARIFGRFEQTASGRLQRGSGLGLAISHELVALMGGHITVQSEPGHGSTFSVHLPLPAVAPAVTHAGAVPSPAPAPTAAPDAHSQPDDATQAPRALLVEDDPVAGAAIAGLVENLGYRVTIAPQALAALAEIDAGGPFDVMLFDFDLPGMDGCELARMLRRRGVETPIIALTAAAHGDEEDRARAAGMDAFLRKPALPGPLQEVLQSTRAAASGRAQEASRKA